MSFMSTDTNMFMGWNYVYHEDPFAFFPQDGLTAGADETINDTSQTVMNETHVVSNNPCVSYAYKVPLESKDAIRNSMDPKDRALIVKTGGVTQRSHNISRSNAILNQPRVEHSHPSEGDVPTPKKPKLEDRISAGSNSTARSSYGDTASARSSMTSIGSDDMHEKTSQSISQSPVPKEPGRTQKAYLCPKCNMGEGHLKGSESPYIVFKNHWDMAGLFAKHIREDHIGDFKHSNSSGYVCCYCTCAMLSGLPSPTCPARFRTKNDMVKHLLDFHAKGPRGLHKFEHCCAPISVMSYPEY